MASLGHNELINQQDEDSGCQLDELLAYLATTYIYNNIPLAFQLCLCTGLYFICVYTSQTTIIVSRLLKIFSFN